MSPNPTFGIRASIHLSDSLQTTVTQLSGSVNLSIEAREVIAGVNIFLTSRKQAQALLDAIYEADRLLTDEASHYCFDPECETGLVPA